MDRPGNGFGRAVRPGPPDVWRDTATLEAICAWDPAEVFAAHPSDIVVASSGDTAVNA